MADALMMLRIKNGDASVEKNLKARRVPSQISAFSAYDSQRDGHNNSKVTPSLTCHSSRDA
jgi:hypothetical protein